MGKEENFFRLIKLVYASCEVLRKVLEKNMGGNTLQQFLQTHKHTLFHLYQNRTDCCLGSCAGLLSKNRILSEQQINILYSLRSQVPGHVLYRGRCVKQTCCCIASVNNVDTQDLDITMLSCILMNCCSLSLLERQYIDQIRQHRNELLHYHKLAIKNSDFICRWKQIETTMSQLSAQLSPIFNQKMKTEIAALKIDPIDKSVCMKMLEDIRKGQTYFKKELKESIKRSQRQVCWWIVFVFIISMTTIGMVAYMFITDERPEDRDKRLLIDKTREILDMHKTDKTYVKTEAVETSVRNLIKHNVILVTGKPHCGKSTLALEVASRFAINGTLTILLDSMTTFSRLITCTDKQIVIIENLFGISRPRFTEDFHSRFLENIQFCIQKNTQIIITSRSLSEKSLNSMTSGYFYKDPSEIVIDLDRNNRLTAHEKIQILKSYMRYFNITSFPVTEHITSVTHRYFPERICAPTDEFHAQQKDKMDVVFYDTISKIDSEIGFPFLCRRFCSYKVFQSLGTSFFKNPSTVLVDDINTIRKKGKKDDEFALQFCVLVYIMLKKELNLNDIDRSLFQLIIDATYSSKKIYYDVQDVKDAIEDSIDFYIKFDIGTSKFSFHHKAIHEIVAFSFASLSKKAQKLFISSCDWDILMTFARPKSYSADTNEHIINVDPEFYFDLLLRFKKEIFEVRVETIIKSEFPTLPDSIRNIYLTSIFDSTPINSGIIESLQRNRVKHTCDPNNWASKIFQKDLSEPTFMSIDEHGNSFVHYWIVEDFERKTILFDTIFNDTPELLEVVNYNRHTPVHFAIYTGRYSIIFNHFCQWFYNISRLFYNYGAEELQTSMRIVALSNFFTILRIYTKRLIIPEGDTYKIEMESLVRQNIEDCEEVFIQGTTILENATWLSSETWKDAFIKLNTRKLQFDQTSYHEDFKPMTTKFFCLRRTLNLTFELYNVLEEENISLKERMAKTFQWTENVIQLHNVVYTIGVQTFRCAMVDFLQQSLILIRVRHIDALLCLQAVREQLHLLLNKS